MSTWQSLQVHSKACLLHLTPSMHAGYENPSARLAAWCQHMPLQGVTDIWLQVRSA
jgi:hypothetical protein